MIDIKTDSRGLVAHGVNACAGCGLELIIRNVLDVLGQDTTIIIPPGCSAMFAGYASETAIKVSAFQGNLENTAAYATGIRAGYAAQGNNHTTVVGFAGDGATVDIGLQSLSGMMERGEDVLYICYDNEAYMNTGIQGSSSTPLGSWSTTTPGKKMTPRKDLLSIVRAHNVPYCASASVAYMADLRKKVEKAKNITGPRVLHIQTPCPTGWGFPTAKSIEVARAAVQTGAWLLYEVEEGKVKVNIKPKELKPISEYLQLQNRFRGISQEDMDSLQAYTTANYNQLVAVEG